MLSEAIYCDELRPFLLLCPLAICGIRIHQVALIFSYSIDVSQYAVSGYDMNELSKGTTSKWLHVLSDLMLQFRNNILLKKTQ